MVDIKPAFLDELDTLEKRKNFKAQIDYLVSENLIETGGKFEFLGWELLTGLYPIDKKKIEAGLIGNWQSYLESKRGTYKSEPVILPQPEPAKPAAKTRLYDVPESVLPYPGIDTQPAATVVNTDNDTVEFKERPRTIKPQRRPVDTGADNYLKEDDFLPFKSRVQKKPEPVSPEPVTPPPVMPVTAAENTDTLPEVTEQGNKPASVTDDTSPPEFSAFKTTYTPPKGDVKDIAVIVKPFSQSEAPAPKPAEPPAAEAEPTPNTAPVLPAVGTHPPPPSVRIAAHRVRRDTDVDDDGDKPIITARTAGLRAKQQQQQPETAADVPAPEPVKETPPAARVVNLSASAAAQAMVKPAEPAAAPVRAMPKPETPQQYPAADRTPRPAVNTAPQPAANPNPQPILPPPTKNFAAIRFDTENNPFASLGKIDLTADAPPKKTLWQRVKWYVIGFAILALAIAYNLYKKRYS